MRVPKIYLETTMFNYYFDNERDAHPDTIRLFEEIKTKKYKAFSSVYAIDELMKAPEEKRSLMMELFNKYDITILQPSKEAESLADMYVNEGIIPKTHIVDSRHIAIAAVNDLEMILSLNFTHIVRKKTIELTEFINVREGYRKVQIYTPMEVVEK